MIFGQLDEIEADAEARGDADALRRADRLRSIWVAAGRRYEMALIGEATGETLDPPTPPVPLWPERDVDAIGDDAQIDAYRDAMTAWLVSPSEVAE